MRKGYFWLLVFIVMTMPARADIYLNCNAYAQESMKHAKENKARGCNIPNSAFDLNYEGHRDWCLRPDVKMENLTGINSWRIAELNKCKVEQNANIEKHREREKFCLKYANEAQKLRNQLNKVCASEGEWPQTLKNDVDFCMENGGSVAELANNNRATKINACLSANITKTYEPVNFRGTPLDRCFENGNGCGKGVADAFCRSKNHATSVSSKRANDDFTIYWFCLDMNAASKQQYIDAGGKCHCTGNCGAFTQITCQGQR